MYVDEIGLRATVSHCLTLLASYAKHMAKQVGDNSLLYNDLLPSAHVALRSTSESVRHEAISVLTALVDEFGGDKEASETLRELSQLRTIADPETCFFENVTHLQLYRRQRAFNRLATGLQSNEVREREGL